jgi:hypothetical protein
MALEKEFKTVAELIEDLKMYPASDLVSAVVITESDIKDKAMEMEIDILTQTDIEYVLLCLNTADTQGEMLSTVEECLDDLDKTSGTTQAIVPLNKPNTVTNNSAENTVEVLSALEEGE